MSLIQVHIKNVLVTLTFEQTEALILKLERQIRDHPEYKTIWADRIDNAKKQYDEAQIKYPDELFK